MTLNEAYANIVQTALTRLPPGDDSVLACMLALHTNDIIFADSCDITDMTWGAAPRRVEAVTRRHAAKIVAAATGHKNDQTSIDYWYAKYSSSTPYEVMEDIPEPLKHRVVEAVRAMKESPLVRDIVEAE